MRISLQSISDKEYYAEALLAGRIVGQNLEIPASAWREIRNKNRNKDCGSCKQVK